MNESDDHQHAADEELDRGDESDPVEIRFQLPRDLGADTIVLVGEFNDWSESEHPLCRDTNGEWFVVVATSPGRYRFRYLLDGDRWENDWNADDYVPNDFGGHDSVIVVHPPAESEPS